MCRNANENAITPFTDRQLFNDAPPDHSLDQDRRAEPRSRFVRGPWPWPELSTSRPTAAPLHALAADFPSRHCSEPRLLQKKTQSELVVRSLLCVRAVAQKDCLYRRLIFRPLDSIQPLAASTLSTSCRRTESQATYNCNYGFIRLQRDRRRSMTHLDLTIAVRNAATGVLIRVPRGAARRLQ